MKQNRFKLRRIFLIEPQRDGIRVIEKQAFRFLSVKHPFSGMQDNGFRHIGALRRLKSKQCRGRRRSLRNADGIG